MLLVISGILKNRVENVPSMKIYVFKSEGFHLLLFGLGLIIGGAAGFLICAVFSASGTGRPADSTDRRKTQGKDLLDE